ncbi:MAG: preprotein translocase subunit SecG [Actinobacteria bacterium]|nr:preprotein translocase subunit SecG [Actinomycetota bacterium]
MTIYNYITMISSVIIIGLIILQTRGASLGAGLGGGGEEINTERRGSDKTIHQITILMVFIFGASLVMHVIA